MSQGISLTTIVPIGYNAAVAVRGTHERAGEGEDFSPLLILVDGSVVNLLEGKAFISSRWCKCTISSAFLCPTPQQTSCCELNDSALTHQTERQERTLEYLICHHATEHK